MLGAVGYVGEHGEYPRRRLPEPWCCARCGRRNRPGARADGGLYSVPPHCQGCGISRSASLFWSIGDGFYGAMRFGVWEHGRWHGPTP